MADHDYTRIPIGANRMAQIESEFGKWKRIDEGR
jgi:hypothetical protein